MLNHKQAQVHPSGVPEAPIVMVMCLANLLIWCVHARGFGQDSLPKILGQNVAVLALVLLGPFMDNFFFKHGFLP